MSLIRLSPFFRLALLFIGCANQATFAQVSNPAFSVDERFLAFQICTPVCRILVRDLNSSFTTEIRSDKDDINLAWPFLSPIANAIGFVSNRRLESGFVDSQIAMVKQGEMIASVLTTSNLLKRKPTSSYDGTTIAFVGQQRSPQPEKGRMYAFADVYELDLGERMERRVTDLRVLDISAPHLLPDRARLTFSTVGSARPRTAGKAPSIPLDKLYPERTLFVLPRTGLQELKPLQTNTPTASNPMPLISGAIAFLSRVNAYDDIRWPYVYDVFVSSDNGVTRHTKVAKANLRQFAISSSGRYVAFVVADARDTSISRLALLDTKIQHESYIEPTSSRIIRVRNLLDESRQESMKGGSR
jgi:dipeptidyl aminopeptidase/acylaminoacyl peptidase